jgi:glutaredoxin
MRVDAALVAVARDAGAGGARSPGAAAAPSPAQAAEAQANLLAAMRRVPITMYWAAWCPTCVKARAWTRANQLAVTERNVDTDEAAKQEIKRYNPRGSIPTIVIDGNTYVGFDKEELWDAIDKVARRELGLPAGQ